MYAKMENSKIAKAIKAVAATETTARFIAANGHVKINYPFNSDPDTPLIKMIFPAEVLQPGAITVKLDNAKQLEYFGGACRIMAEKGNLIIESENLHCILPGTVRFPGIPTGGI